LLLPVGAISGAYFPPLKGRDPEPLGPPLTTPLPPPLPPLLPPLFLPPFLPPDFDADFFVAIECEPPLVNKKMVGAIVDNCASALNKIVKRSETPSCIH
jgi:hypothetical protein